MLLLKFWQKQTARFVCRRLVLQVRTMSEETKEQPQILKWASKTGEFVRNPSSFRYFCAHTLDPRSRTFWERDRVATVTVER